MEMLQLSNANDRACVRVTMSQLRFIQLRVDAQTLWTGACVDPRVPPTLSFVSESRIWAIFLVSLI